MADQRSRMATVKREQEQYQLKVLDDARRSFIQRQKAAQEESLRDLDEDLEHKVQMREQETAMGLLDIEISALEAETRRARIAMALNKEDELLAVSRRNGTKSHPGRSGASFEAHALGPQNADSASPNMVVSSEIDFLRQHAQVPISWSHPPPTTPTPIFIDLPQHTNPTTPPSPNTPPPTPLTPHQRLRTMRSSPITRH